MKNTFFLLLLTLFAVSCGDGEESMEDMTLEDKRELLREKQNASQALSQEIEMLQTEIEAQDTTMVKRLPTVTTQAVQRTTFSQYVEVQGSVEAEDLVSVSSETGGRIIDLRMEEGKAVRKGQLVAKLDLDQVDKQIDELNTQLELANDLYERQKRLWDQKIGSEVQYLQAKNNKERLEKGLESLKLQLGKANIYAPISGVVEMLMLRAGEVAAPGAPIAQILNTSKVKIVADVPETLIQAVSKGERVIVTIPALNWEKEVRITDLGRTIDKTNRTLRVEANISGGANIKPNLLATMRIKELEIADAIIVPLELVQQEVGGKKYVMIKSEDTQGEAIAKKVYVQTGESADGNVVVKEGLTGSEQVIAKGARGIKNGSKIELVQDDQVARVNK